MPLKIFIGSSSNNEDAAIEGIYEYTLRKNCSHDIEITWMRQTNSATSYWSGWSTSKWHTPFSGFRWAIAEACNFSGLALYSDVDMINFRDITALFNIDMRGKPFAARTAKRFNNSFQPCLMLIDCSKAKNIIVPKKELMKDSEMHKFYMNSLIKKNFLGRSKYFHEIDPLWNCLDGEDIPIDEIYQLHFTNMSTQPWKPSWYQGSHAQHPRQDIINLYYELLEESAQHGFAPKKNKGPFVKYNIIGS
jgi:lipopolysaccharide biosynthesis glycosyltransferase